jgi:hypothetical protein
MPTMTTPKTQNEYTNEMTPDVALPPATGKEKTMIAELGLVAALTLAPTTAAAALTGPQKDFRECVAQRESGGSYTAENRSEPSSAMGRYQFLDGKWRHGLAHMVADALRDNGMPWKQARKVRADLRDTPIRKWKPVHQDIGFATVLNARGPWSGWDHWVYPGSRCNNLVPAGAR